MSAWGSGPFENDAALDYVSEIQSIEHLVREVRFLDSSEEISVDQASRIIAAAECVAAMRGHPHSDLPQGLAERLTDFGELRDDLHDNARDAVSMVISSSELGDMWAGTPDRANFNRAITGLIDRLNQPLGKATAPAKSSKKPNLSPCWICGEEMGEEFTSISITLDPELGMSQGGSVHLACLNAALHPRYLIQDWQFDDKMLARLTGEF